MGLLDFTLNSSPRPELFSSPGLLLAHPCSAQPQSVPGVPNSRVPNPPAPRFFWSAPGVQPQSLPGVPNPRSAQPTWSPNPGVPNPVRVSQIAPDCPAECPTPVFLECPQSLNPSGVPWSASQSLRSAPECPVPSPRVSGVPNPRVSLSREGGHDRSKIICVFWGRCLGVQG